MKKFRPSAVPLITVDPYFSIWSMSDHLYDDATHHWTGRRNPMTAVIVVDGKYYKLMGDIMPNTDRQSRMYERVLPQISLTVTPTQTKYTFANETIQVTLLFTTPLLLDRLDILSRPVSYIEYDIQIIDGTKHEISFYYQISAECCIDSYEDEIIGGKTAQSVYVGNAVQKILNKSGDSVCIDWGYLHVADPDAKLIKAQLHFRQNAPELEMGVPYKVFKEYPYIRVVKEELHGVITVAYDDINPISYLGEVLDDYYKKFYATFDEMLAAAVREYEEIKVLCGQFDDKLMAETSAISEKYEKITSLAYRQVIGAHKLVEDKKGNILFLSKECHSNGCIGTLDVTYPSIPLFLKYNTELIKGMLRPILDFAGTDMWPYEFAPHDVGQYPLANKQVYGYRSIDPDVLSKQMPVEECGNMLLCMAAVAQVDGNNTFALQNKAILKQWTDYLVKYGYDPGNQLCTDDFAGHLAHNCNLSLKAILGIASYSRLFDEPAYMDIAREYARKWEMEAANEAGTRLAFDREDSWSLKYNIVWDKLLGFHLFGENVFEREIAVYRAKMNRYGVPLDNRNDYTKIDWLVWTTVMTDDKAYLDEVTECIYNYICETKSRVPISDWYYTTNGYMETCQNRTVLGGIYIPLLK